MIQVRDAGAPMLHATLQSCTIASVVLSHKKRGLMRNGKLDPGSVRFAWLKSIMLRTIDLFSLRNKHSVVFF
jgi:hypothetical protein